MEYSYTTTSGNNSMRIRSPRLLPVLALLAIGVAGIHGAAPPFDAGGASAASSTSSSSFSSSPPVTNADDSNFASISTRASTGKERRPLSSQPCAGVDDLGMANHPCRLAASPTGNDTRAIPPAHATTTTTTTATTHHKAPPRVPPTVGVAHGGAFAASAAAASAAPTSPSKEAQQPEQPKQEQDGQEDDSQSFSYPARQTSNNNNNNNGALPQPQKASSRHNQTPSETPTEAGGPLRVLFLSSDTGGGHRASAESLAKSFQNHYPGTTYDVLDVWTDHGVWPYHRLVPSYQHLSAHPRQWRLFYHLSNNYLYELAYDLHSRLTCERRIRRRIREYHPDVVVSVHPTMNHVPLLATRKIGRQTNRRIPFFTVVTDLGSAHTTWFQRHVEKIFVASDRLATLAKRRGRIRTDQLVMSGLPIRHDFAVQAGRLGDRTTAQGRQYQMEIKAKLGLDADRRMVLVMGGGEGVGSLADIVDGLYAKFRKAGVDATICVVCGRNDRLKEELTTKDWEAVLQESHVPPKRRRWLVEALLRPHRSPRIQQTLDRVHHREEVEEEAGIHPAPGRVDVVGLGFVTNMAEYMVAADVVVTKAGPGTIAEAAAVGLPVMLTSFLPGQEAGNVNVVLDGGFGDHCEDPDGIADEVSCWLQDEQLMRVMSQQAREVGHPHAASDIVLEIGQATHEALRRNGVQREQQQSHQQQQSQQLQQP